MLQLKNLDVGCHGSSYTIDSINTECCPLRQTAAGPLCPVCSAHAPVSVRGNNMRCIREIKVIGKVHPCTGTGALYRPYGPKGEGGRGVALLFLDHGTRRR